MFAALVFVELTSIRSSGAEAKAYLGEAVVAIATDQPGLARERLVESSAAVEEARARSTRPHVRLAAAMPFVGGDVEVVQASVAAASDITAAVEVAAGHLDGLDGLYDTGKVDLEEAAELGRVFSEAADLMGSASEKMAAAPTPRFAVVAETSGEVAERARQGVAVMKALEHLLDGVAAVTPGDPFQTLLVFTNGAELRSIGGVPVFLARIDVEADGQVSLGEVVPTPAAHPDQPVQSPEAFDAMFGRYAGSRLWSNLTLAADGPTVALVASRMYEARTGVAPDLVVVADLVATGNILDTFPPVEVEGSSLEATTLATDFLYDTYRSFPGPEQNSYLVEVFTDVFGQVVGAEIDVSDLLRVTVAAVESGRLLAWSPDPDVQEGIVTSGAAHPLAEGSPGRVDVTVQNFGATKLDVYTRVETKLDVELVGCAVVGRLDVTITESTPPELREVLAFSAGENRWWVNVYLSERASPRGYWEDGEPAGGDLASWEGRPVASMLVDAPFGGSTTATVEWIEPLPPSGTITVATPATVSQAAASHQIQVPSDESCG